MRLALSLRFPLVLFYKILLVDRGKLSPSLQAMWDTFLGPGTRQGALAPGRAEKIEQHARREQFSENFDRFRSHGLGASRNSNIIGKRSLREQFSRMEHNHPNLGPGRSRAVEFSWTSRFQNLKLNTIISI